MYKKITIHIMLVFGFITLWTGCSEDLGNYDYSEINEVEFGDVENSYVAFFGEPFKIEPELIFTQDTGNDESAYTYTWTTYASAGLPADIRVELGTEKDLDLDRVTLAPGTYQLTYQVYDLNTGVEWQKKIDLSVQSTVYEGWLLLSDVDGQARLDMISLLDGEYTPIYDILDFTGSSLELQGQPIEVVTYTYDPQFYGIYVTTTGNGTTKIHPETFDWETEYRLSFEAVANFPTDFGADFIQPTRSSYTTSYMYKDGDVYYYFRTFNYRYGTPINVVQGELFEAAPFIGDSNVGADDNLFYDTTNKRFVRHNYRNTTMNEMPEGTLFDYNTGKDLVWMEGTNYNAGEVFAILEDPADNKLYLARISSRRGVLQQAYYEEIPATIAADMAQADHFSVNRDFGYLFYSLNGKVYEYDFSLQTTKLMIDRPGQEITVMEFDLDVPYDFFDPEEPDYRNKLLVGTYDPASSAGTFEIYSVPPVNGDLELNESYNGFGKIVSAEYRIRY